MVAQNTFCTRGVIHVLPEINADSTTGGQCLAGTKLPILPQTCALCSDRQSDKRTLLYTKQGCRPYMCYYYSYSTSKKFLNLFSLFKHNADVVVYHVTIRRKCAKEVELNLNLS